MITLDILLYIFMILFAIIGAIRGVSKELIASASGILAIFIINMIVPKIFGDVSGERSLLLQLGVLAFCGFFGYQTPNYRRFSELGHFNRNSFMDVILGGISGGINGFLFIGSAWYFLAKQSYPFSWVIAPDPASEAGKAAVWLLENSLPKYLDGVPLYIALAIAFAIIIGVFI